MLPTTKRYRRLNVFFLIFYYNYYRFVIIPFLRHRACGIRTNIYIYNYARITCTPIYVLYTRRAYTVHTSTLNNGS